MDARSTKTIRGTRSTSHMATATSSKGRSSSEAKPASPKVLTSFPSLSPQSSASPKRKRSSREATRSASSLVDGSTIGVERRPSAMSSRGPSRRTSTEASTPETPTQNRKPSTSIGKTLRGGAASLHKSILAGLTFRTNTQEESLGTVFKDPDWDAADPLENASDEQIQRIIEKNGGIIAILRQYSKDLAECNSRVAMERNMKLDLVEQNRKLQNESELLRLQLDEQSRKYKNVQNLFKRFVRPEYPGQIQIVDSPNGHYVLGGFYWPETHACTP